MSGPQILDAIKAAGIVGLGGAGFPTHVKLAPVILTVVHHCKQL